MSPERPPCAIVCSMYCATDMHVVTLQVTLLHNTGDHIFFSQEQLGEVAVTTNLGDSPCKIELSSLVPPDGLVSILKFRGIRKDSLVFLKTEKSYIVVQSQKLPVYVVILLLTISSKTVMYLLLTTL